MPVHRLWAAADNRLCRDRMTYAYMSLCWPLAWYEIGGGERRRGAWNKFGFLQPCASAIETTHPLNISPVRQHTSTEQSTSTSHIPSININFWNHCCLAGMSTRPGVSRPRPRLRSNSIVMACNCSLVQNPINPQQIGKQSRTLPSFYYHIKYSWCKLKRNV